MATTAAGCLVSHAKDFGARLKQLRESAGLSQAELARRSGVRQNSISRYEAGKGEPTWGAVVALSTALGVSVDAFTDPPAPTEA